MNKIGLVLSGGGARGFAHIGLIKTLDEVNAKPAYVSGCSMGAIIGALYCMGYSGIEIEEKINSFGLKDALKVTLNTKAKRGKLEAFFDDLFEGKKFEDLKIPFYVNAVDIETGEEIIFDKGSLSRAVRASMSIPGLFKPVVINNRVLVDGAVRNNIPLKVLLNKNLDGILCFNVGPHTENRSIIEEVSEDKSEVKAPSLTKILIKSLLIMQSSEYMINYSKEKSNLFIVPDLKKYTMADFMKHKKIIKIGEEESKKYEREINRLFNKKKIRNFIKRKLTTHNF